MELAIGAGVGLMAYLVVRGVNVMPVVLLAGIGLMLTQTAGLKNAGARKVHNASSAVVPGVKFEDIGGQSAAKKELLEAIEFIMNREQIKHMGIRPLKGVLLTGPPGTGKTLLAKAAAHHTGSVFLAGAGSDFVEMYAGVGAQRVRDLFRKARETARREKKPSAIIFMDAPICYTPYLQPADGGDDNIRHFGHRFRESGHLCPVVDRRAGERHHA
jgi:ATP-dependent Zn protease